MRIRETAVLVLTLLSFASLSVQLSSAQTCQLTIALVLDISGSMRNVVPEWNVTKAAVQIEAARSFVSEASSDWRIGVVEYRDNAVVRMAVTTDKNAVISSMSGTAKGDTNLAEGINLAATVLTDADYGRLVMIVVGDGNPNIGVDPRQRAIDAAALAKRSGIYILAAGLTPSPSAYALMKEISSNAQYALNAIEVNSLRTWFQDIKDKLCNLVEETASVVSGTSTSLGERNILAWVVLVAMLIAVSLFEYRHQISQKLGKRARITQEPSRSFAQRLKRLRMRRREEKTGSTVLPAKTSATAKSCQYCGRSILPSDKFCDRCGRAVSRS